MRTPVVALAECIDSPVTSLDRGVEYVPDDCRQASRRPPLTAISLKEVRPSPGNRVSDRSAIRRDAQAGQVAELAIGDDPIQADPIVRNGPVASRLLASVTAMMRRQTAELTATRHELDVEALLRKTAEDEIVAIQRRYAVAQDRSARYRKRVKTISRRFITAQDEERRIISRELHDVVAQLLAGIVLRLSVLASRPRYEGDRGHADIVEVQRMVNNAVAAVQRFARDLRPSMLDDLGLTPALATFLEQFSESTGIRTRFTSIRLARALDTEQRTAFFRIAQEACHNVSRHAHATRIRVRIHRQQNGLRMEIHDNGQAFSVATALPVQGRKRLGILGMRERMRIIGGRLAIVSAPRHGTSIVAVVPLSRIGRAAGRRTTSAVKSAVMRTSSSHRDPSRTNPMPAAVRRSDAAARLSVRAYSASSGM